MENYSPNIEILPDPRAVPIYPRLKPWYLSSRMLIFMAIFFPAALGSLAYIYSRPAIYRSSATLLTSAMAAIDQEISTADAQHVAIQKQILLGHELLAETLERLKASRSSRSILPTLPEIQEVLTVEPVNDTNLVEIQAEGADAAFLPLLINTWIDVYLDARQAEVRQLTDDTTVLIEDELEGLEAKVVAKRTELEEFRANNEILSTGRDENEALARLKGLNDSLNRASEEEVKAKAKLEAVKLAIAQGQPVVPQQDQGILQDLAKRRQELREKQAKLTERFTQDYINLQPALKIIPKEIEKINQEIKKTIVYGKEIVLSEAEKDYASSQQTVKVIRAQMANHKKQASLFTTVFAKHETLTTDLESLEKLLRETQERLVKIQTRHKEKYPQVTVINRAFQPDKPFRPHYHRNALIATIVSMLLGLFGVWIVDYLTKQREAPTMPGPIILSGISLNRRVTDLSRRSTDLIDRQSQGMAPIEQRRVNALAGPSFRELSCYELELLLASANLKGKQQIGCLLSGLTPEETATLTPEQIDLDANLIYIDEPLPRTIPLHAPLRALLEQSGGQPAWDGHTASVNEIKAALFYVAIDSGIGHPEEITAGAIRHSYIAYLVRQGLRLIDLESIVGALESAVMSDYSAFSPPQRGLAISEIKLMHPALLEISA